MSDLEFLRARSGIRPTSPEVLMNPGSALQHANDASEAADESIRRALEIDVHAYLEQAQQTGGE